MKLGEAFVEVMGDVDPFSAGFEEAMAEASGMASDELTSGMEDAVDEAGSVMTDGLEEAASSIELESPEIDVEADLSAFDEMGGAAENAADEVVAAFDGVGDEITAEMETGSESASGLTDSLGSVQGAIGTVAGGAGLEAFARAQAPLTEQSARLAAQLGGESDAIRELALESANVTRPLDQVLNTMEMGAQQGLRNREDLMQFVAAWDTVGDATGENAETLARMSPALKTLGIEATNVEDSFSALGFVQENTQLSTVDFMKIIERTAPDLKAMNADVDDVAGVLGAMEQELGITGRAARQEFQQAVREADGDMGKMLETLGLSQEQFDEYRGKVEESSGVIERNAGLHGESYTVMQKVMHGAEELAFQFGGVADVAGTLAAPLGALGPMMMGLNATQNVLASGMGKKLVGGLKAAAGGFRTLAVSILTNPIFLIGALIVGIVAIIWYFRDEIIGAFKAAWDWVKEKTSAFWNWLTESVSETVDAVVTWFRDLRDSVVGWVEDLWDTVIGAVTDWFNGLVDLVEWLFKTYVNTWKAIGRAIFNFVKDLVKRVINTITGWVRNIISSVRWLWQQWVNIVHRIKNAVVSAVTGLVNLVVSTIRSWVSRVVGFVRGLRSDFTGTISQLISNVISTFRQMPGRIMRAIGNLGRLLLGAGKDLIRGLIDGIGNMAGAVKDKISDVVSSAKDAITSGFGLFSPSKVFAGYGENLMEGMALGLSGGSDAALDEIERFANDMRSAADMGALFNEDDLRPPTAFPRPDAGPAGTELGQRQTGDINLNYYGPTTGSERVREMEWAMKYAKR